MSCSRCEPDHPDLYCIYCHREALRAEVVGLKYSLAERENEVSQMQAEVERLRELLSVTHCHACGYQFGVEHLTTCVHCKRQRAALEEKP